MPGETEPLVPLCDSLARLQTAVAAAARAGDDLARACQANSAERLLENLAHLFEARRPVDTPAEARRADAAAETPPCDSAAAPPSRGPVRRRHRRSAIHRKWWKKNRRIIGFCAGYLLLAVGGYLLFGFFKLLIVSLSD